MKISLNGKKVLSFLLALTPFLINYDLPTININITLIIYLMLFFSIIVKMIKGNISLEKIKGFVCNKLMLVMFFYIVLETIYIENPVGIVNVLINFSLLYIQLVGFIVFFFL